MTEAVNMKKYDRRLITESKASRRLLASWRSQANYIIWRKSTSFFFDKYVCPILGKLHRLEQKFTYFIYLPNYIIWRKFTHFYSISSKLYYLEKLYVHLSFFDKSQANYIIWRKLTYFTHLYSISDK